LGHHVSLDFANPALPASVNKGERDKIMKTRIKILLFLLILEIGFILTLNSYQVREYKKMWGKQQTINKSYNTRLNRLEHPELTRMQRKK